MALFYQTLRRKRRIKLAIVVQRFGEDFAGGSEYLARTYAKYLGRFGEVVVLTTCARSFETWKNEYPPGEAVVDGIKVLRFPVEAERDFASFSKSSYAREIHGYQTSAEHEISYFKDQGPLVPELIDYIASHRDAFDTFLFFTYLYYTTVFGIRPVLGKSFLVPTAHDEPPFYFAPTFVPIFEHVNGIIYLSDAERNLVHRVYPGAQKSMELKGLFGINPPEDIAQDEEAALRQKYSNVLSQMYFLFLGRASASKNCPALVHAFSQARHRTQLRAYLVFCGSDDFDLPSRPDIINVGFVSEKEKSFLLRHAAALVNPSAYESLSLVMLEAWNQGTMVVVNGASHAMREQVKASGGGLFFNSEAMFEGIMVWCMKHGPLLSEIGRRGQDYIRRRYNWDNAFRETLRFLVKS